MKTSDMIVVGAIVMILSFPLMWLVMLLATGNAKLVFEGDLARAIEVETMARVRRSATVRDSLILANSYSFHANAATLDSIASERERMVREQERLDFLIAELHAERQKIEAERARIEGERQTIQSERQRFEGAIDNQINAQNAANLKRVSDLARIYQAMRPNEAAQILETLPDDLCVDILRTMTDDRQRSRILAAMEIDNATRLSEMLALRASR